jgi:hypothetical protein
VLLTIFLWSVRSYRPRPPAPAPAAIAQLTVTPISRESIARELSPLEQQLDQLEIELVTLSRRASLTDVKRQTETLLEAYPH